MYRWCCIVQTFRTQDTDTELRAAFSTPVDKVHTSVALQALVLVVVPKPNLVVQSACSWPVGVQLFYRETN